MLRRSPAVAAVIAAFLLGAGAGVAGTAALHRPPAALTVPADAAAKLSRLGVVLAGAETPGHMVTMPAVIARVPPDRRVAVAGAYLVSMIDTDTSKSCVCWLVLYGPGLHTESSAGVPGNIAADFYDASSGRFVTGVVGRV